MIKFDVYNSYIKSCYIGKTLVTAQSAMEAVIEHTV